MQHSSGVPTLSLISFHAFVFFLWSLSFSSHRDLNSRMENVTLSMRRKRGRLWGLHSLMHLSGRLSLLEKNGPNVTKVASYLLWCKSKLSRLVADQWQAVCDHLRSNCLSSHKNSTLVCSPQRRPATVCDCLTILCEPGLKPDVLDRKELSMCDKYNIW